jgi:hypothetical protein
MSLGVERVRGDVPQGPQAQLATTTSDAHDLPHAEHGKTAAAKLARYQRMMARRATPRNRPDTKGYRKAVRRPPECGHRGSCRD